jgi:hypothetical protein
MKTISVCNIVLIVGFGWRPTESHSGWLVVQRLAGSAAAPTVSGAWLTLIGEGE